MTTNNFLHDWIKFALRCLESEEFIRANQTVQHPPLKLSSTAHISKYSTKSLCFCPNDYILISREYVTWSSPSILDG